MKIQGAILSGIFDESENEFTLQHVKHHTTESSLQKNQILAIYDYLMHHEDEQGGLVLTLYDQMPVKLTQDEVTNILRDIEEINKYFH